MDKVKNFASQEEENNRIDKLYEEERDRLLEGKQKIPSQFFCKEFIERLPTDEELDEEGYYDDTGDYMSWGYALFGYWEHGEQAASSIDIWDWIYFYEGIEEGNHNQVAEALEGILDKVVKIEE